MTIQFDLRNKYYKTYVITKTYKLLHAINILESLYCIDIQTLRIMSLAL